MRKFETGATRDDDSNKYDYEGFLSPSVLIRYAEYMHENRKQADGVMRESDNWQKGIPIRQYMKSKLRHIIETWRIHRDIVNNTIDNKYRPADDSWFDILEDSLCAELFNTMGMLHELLNLREDETVD